MINRQGIAEIRFGDMGIALYGSIRDLSSSTISVELITMPRDPLALANGTETEFLYSNADVTYASVATVDSLDAGRLELTVKNRPQPISRRNNRRAKCDMPVQYRALRSDGRVGAWMECTADDISTGGIGLLFPGGVEIPRRLETRFVLPTVQALPSGHSRLIMANTLASTDHRPMKATGRVTHSRPMPYGRIRAGVVFNAIALADIERIAAYMVHLLH